MFGAAGINFGYAVELTLKFILAFNKWPQKKLYNHNIKNYYQNVIDSEYIKPVNVSDDFINFVNDRLNARYPSYISAQFAATRPCNRHTHLRLTCFIAMTILYFN